MISQPVERFFASFARTLAWQGEVEKTGRMVGFEGCICRHSVVHYPVTDAPKWVGATDSFLSGPNGAGFGHVLAVAFFLVSFFFVWKSFYGMRIVKAPTQKEQPQPELTGSVR